MAAQVARIPFAILSLNESFPHVDIITQLAEITAFDIHIDAGTDVTAEVMHKAKVIVKVLESLKGNPDISEEMIATAHDRVSALQQARITTMTPDQGAGFTAAQMQQLQGIVQPLRDEMREDMRGLRDEMREDIRGLREDIHSLKFRLDNNEIAQRNKLLLESRPAALECRKKQVPGDGLNLCQQLGVAVGANPGNPLLGSKFRDEIDTGDLTAADISGMIRFYNETFGIVAGDQLSQRRIKVSNWLCNLPPSRNV